MNNEIFFEVILKLREELRFLSCIDHEVPMQIDIPDESDKFPAVLMIHGFMSSRNNDNHMLARISKKIVEAGIVAARIDLCSMGENLYSRENYGMKVMTDEVKASFKYLQSLPYVEENNVGLLGHSLGGRLVFTCSTLPAKIIVSLNGAINTSEPLEMAYDKFQMDNLGYCIVHTSSGGVELVYRRFFDELKTTLNDNIKNFKNPILVEVCISDPTLDPNISLNFIKNCHMDNVDSFTVENANHTYNVETGDFTKLNEVIGKVVPWISSHIKLKNQSFV